MEAQAKAARDRADANLRAQQPTPDADAKVRAEQERAQARSRHSLPNKRGWTRRPNSTPKRAAMSKPLQRPDRPSSAKGRRIRASPYAARAESKKRLRKRGGKFQEMTKPAARPSRKVRRDRRQTQEGTGRGRRAQSKSFQREINRPGTATAPAATTPGVAPASPVAPTSTRAPRPRRSDWPELLRRYQADEITPLQYHTERAGKIVAELRKPRHALHPPA